MAAALGLEKRLGRGGGRIILIDRRDYQLFNTRLYEVAAAEEEFTSVAGLKKSICLPIGEIIKNRKIEFKKAEVKNVDLARKQVTAGIEKLDYDYLIAASGLRAGFGSVPGAEKFSMPLVTLTDALALRKRLEFIFEEKALSFKKERIRLVILGGGYDGCQLAAELTNFVKILCWKYGYPLEKAEIVLAEGGSRLLTSASSETSKLAYWRLTELGVRVELSSPALLVDNHSVNFYGGQRLEYDAAIWCQDGEAALPAGFETLAKDGGGRLKVSGNLQVEGADGVFAAGSLAAIKNPEGDYKIFAGMEESIRQGAYLAKSFPRLIKNSLPKAYTPGARAFRVYLGGRWAVYESKKASFSGWPAYLFAICADFRYFCALLGPLRAVKFFWFGWKEFKKISVI